MSKLNLRNLQDLYLEELKAAYDFEHQLLEALPKMEATATNSELKMGFADHRRQTAQHARRIDRVFVHLGQKPERKACKGMRALISEGEDLIKGHNDSDTVDAALIAAAQRVEHYEIAVYGALCAYAKLLGYRPQAELLHENLEEEKQTDARLTRLAESTINLDAASTASN